MPEPIKFTNGMAYWAYTFVSTHKGNLEDLFVSASLAVKFKAAKRGPAPKENESAIEYGGREDEWLDSSFSDVELSEEEREYLRKIFKAKSDDNSLFGNIHLAELAAAIGLKK